MFRRLGSSIPWRSIHTSFAARAGTRSTPYARQAIQRHSHGANGWQHKRHGYQQLKSSAYTGMLSGAIYMSIALCYPDADLSFGERSRLGVDLVQSVNMQKVAEKRLARYWELGPSILSTYCDHEVTQHGHLPLDDESEWRDLVDTQLYSAPDPDDPEKNFVVCQLSFKDQEEIDLYVSTHGNLLTDVSEDILPCYHAVAQSHRVNRGVVLLLAPSGEWKSIYFDGKRYISVVFLEWQTAESMALP